MGPEIADLLTGRSRTNAENGRIVITGTGRAGTTFLMQLFAALGFDTGYSLAQAIAAVDETSHAGLEQHFVDSRDNPYVIKSPWFAEQLLETLDSHCINIYAAIIPVRDLFEAAESRRKVYYAALSTGLDPLRHPGSLMLTNRPSNQEDVLATLFYKTVNALVKHEINTVFVEFPRFVLDCDYLFRRLAWLLEDHGIDFSEFAEAHRRVARPDLIGGASAERGVGDGRRPHRGSVWARSAVRAKCFRLAIFLRWKFRRWHVLPSKRSPDLQAQESRE